MKLRAVLLLAGVVLCGCPQSISGDDRGGGTTGGVDGGTMNAGTSGTDAGTECTVVAVPPEPCVSAGPGDRIGIFRGGVWVLDTDGDHTYSADCDETFTFGEDGDLPVTGDFRGIGRVDVGVYRAGTWILDTDHDRKLTACDRTFSMGSASDVPLVGHWGPSGRLSFGTYSPATQVFSLDLNGDGELSPAERFPFGTAGDQPVVGRWRAGGPFSVGLFSPEEPNNAFWSLDVDGNRAWTQGVDLSISFGLKDDVPVTGDWTGSGSTRIGVFRGGAWTLEKDLAGNPGDASNWIVATYGESGDLPVVMRP